LLNCRLLETPLGCSVTVEYERLEWQEDARCNLRFHGRHGLSPTFPLAITREGHMQTNFVFDDVGEVRRSSVGSVVSRSVWIDYGD
jgi:hypothetical protein